MHLRNLRKPLATWIYSDSEFGAHGDPGEGHVGGGDVGQAIHLQLLEHVPGVRINLALPRAVHSGLGFRGLGV